MAKSNFESLSNLIYFVFYFLTLHESLNFALDNDNNRTVISSEEFKKHSRTSQDDSLGGSAQAQLPKLLADAFFRSHHSHLILTCTVGHVNNLWLSFFSFSNRNKMEIAFRKNRNI